MLAQRADRDDRQPTFSRRDLGRLLVASGVLILALTAIFAVDIIPTRVDVKVGEVASADLLAPRTITYTSATRTKAARDTEAAGVVPQYDFTPDKATAVARQQALAFDRAVAPVDNAFDPATAESDRIALLDAALPGLSDESRANLMALPLGRWKAVRDESARILDQLETSELRDADLAEVRDRLAGRILGGLNEAERKLAAEIVAPLLVANSDFDQAETDAAKRRAADSVPPVLVSLTQGQAIVRKGDPITADVVEAVDCVRPEHGPVGLRQAGRLGALLDAPRRPGARLDLALPAGAVAPEQRPDPRWADARVRDVRPRGHGRAGHHPVHRADGGRRDPRGPPARRRHRDDAHRGDRDRRRGRQRRLGRDDGVTCSSAGPPGSSRSGAATGSTSSSRPGSRWRSSTRSSSRPSGSSASTT